MASATIDDSAAFPQFTTLTISGSVDTINTGNLATQIEGYMPATAGTFNYGAGSTPTGVIPATTWFVIWSCDQSADRETVITIDGTASEVMQIRASINRDR